MASWSSFDAYAIDLGALAKDLEQDRLQRIAKRMADEGAKIFERVASGDLGGDPKFSGWAPSLDTRVKLVRSGAVLMPTRTGAGPITVAQQGRNQGNASGFSGPGINTRTGRTSRRKDGSLRQVRSRKARRWNGRTQGKRTADKAIAIMDRELPKIAEKEIRRIITKRFDLD
jgi:hypothetical protein